MYSTYNEGKSIAAERFIRTLKNKMYKYMTSISKNVHFDIYMIPWINIAIHTLGKLRRRIADVKSNAYVTSYVTAYVSTEINDGDLKLVILLEYQNIKTFLQKVMF